MPERPEDPRNLGLYFALAQVGMEMVVPVGLGIGLDMKLDWAPWGSVVGALLGLTMGITHLVVLANKQNDENQRKRRDVK